MRGKPLSILGLLRKSVIFSTLLAIIPFSVAIVSSDSIAQSGTGIIRVAPTGSDTPGCGSVGSPCATLQFAVDEIPVGGSTTIQVAAGTYVFTGSGVSQTGREVVRILGRNITMEGGYTTAFTTADPVTNVTIIDGQNARRGITTEPVGATKTNLTLSGVTLTNGKAPTDVGVLNSFGGGLDSFDSTVTLSNVKATNNSAQGLDSNSDEPGNGAGGGLSLRQTTATLSNVELTGNTSQGGAGSGSAPRGGLGVGGGLFAFQSTISIDGLTASNNVAQAGDAPSSTGLDLGGIQRADGIGGGLFFVQSSMPSITNLTVTGNTAQGGKAADKGGLGLGGAITIELAPDTVSLSSSSITDNIAQGGTASGAQGGAGLGGGLFITDSDMNVDALTILNNQAIGVSGGTTGGDAGGAGVYFTLANLSNRQSMNATNMIVGSNTATAGTGATNGLAIGGGLHYSFNSDVTLNHVTLARNIVESGVGNQGAAIFVQNGAILTSNFGIIADHTGPEAVRSNPTGIATFNRTLWDGNTTNSVDITPNFTDNNPQSGSPDFVDPTGSPPDFHIKETSAARDKAIGSTTPTDIDGEKRPFGSEADLGADEFAPPLSVVLDITANGSGGTVNINKGDPLSIAISLSSSGSGGPADWWIIVSTPSGWQYYDLSLGDYTPGLMPSLQGVSLVDFGSSEIFNTSGLGAGTYTYYFAVDVGGQLFFDSVVVTVTAIDPAPQITANGSGGTVNINEGGPLSIAISLSSGSFSGESADWWIIVSTSSGWEYYDFSLGDYTSGLMSSLPGLSLVDFGSNVIFNTSGLSAGTYTYYFAVDLVGQLFIDSVVVIVNISP